MVKVVRAPMVAALVSLGLVVGSMTGWAGGSVAKAPKLVVVPSAGLKNGEVAEGCGKSQNHISDVVNGKVKPSPELMTFLAESGIDANWLLTGQGSPYAAGSRIAAEDEASYECAEGECVRGCPVPKTSE